MEKPGLRNSHLPSSKTPATFGFAREVRSTIGVEPVARQKTNQELICISMTMFTYSCFFWPEPKPIKCRDTHKSARRPGYSLLSKNLTYQPLVARYTQEPLLLHLITAVFFEVAIFSRGHLLVTAFINLHLKLFSKTPTQLKFIAGMPFQGCSWLD